MENKLKHLGIIMDGNRRWAEKNGYSVLGGHKAGAQNIKMIMRLCKSKGIKILSVYALSTENWLKRSQEELMGLMGLLKSFMLSERNELNKEGVKINVLGDVSVFPDDVKEILKETNEMLIENNTFIFNIAINYGGRNEIVRAVKKMIENDIKADEVDEENISKNLDTASMPDPDLIVRTGGEFRTSNFLIWQSAYSEFYFPNVLWPDFDEAELDKAIEEYNGRKRRYGGNSKK